MVFSATFNNISVTSWQSDNIIMQITTAESMNDRSQLTTWYLVKKLETKQYTLKQQITHILDE